MFVILHSHVVFPIFLNKNQKKKKTRSRLKLKVILVKGNNKFEVYSPNRNLYFDDNLSSI